MINLEREKIWVTGHTGMVGRALCNQLTGLELITANSRDLDLRDEAAVLEFAKEHKPTIVFNLAAKVGGIHANQTKPVEFLLDNIKIQNNVIQAAEYARVKKYVFMGSACTYPKYAKQPISEDALFAGELEPTNIWYATAKLAGIKLAQAMRTENRVNTITVMPANSYGPGDNFSGDDSHVIPALFKKVHAAKLNGSESVELWGSGKPLREFLYVDDLASALVFLCENYDSDEIINVGSGEETSILALMDSICQVVNYSGKILFDKTKPDGAPRKILDSTKLQKMGWSPQINLQDGLRNSYLWALDNQVL